jgi:hypothetical protein
MERIEALSRGTGAVSIGVMGCPTDPGREKRWLLGAVEDPIQGECKVGKVGLEEGVGGGYGEDPRR